MYRRDVTTSEWSDLDMEEVVFDDNEIDLDADVTELCKGLFFYSVRPGLTGLTALKTVLLFGRTAGLWCSFITVRPGETVRSKTTDQTNPETKLSCECKYLL